jgi:hypothetical protein
MADVKEQVAATIVKARENLEQALVELERLSPFDPSAVAFAAHALNNYLTVTGGTIELLLSALTAHPDPEIHTWLAGLHHVTTASSSLSFGVEPPCNQKLPNKPHNQQPQFLALKRH